MSKFKCGTSMTSINIYGLESEQSLLKKRLNFLIHIYNQNHFDRDDHGSKIKVPIIIKHNIRNNTLYVSSIHGIPFDDIKEEFIENKDCYKSIVLFYLSITISKNDKYEIFHKKIFYNPTTDSVEILDIESALQDYEEEFKLIFNKLRKRE